jgi:hypothetical protein
MTLKSALPPADREPLDENGRLKVAWANYFRDLRKMPAAPLADLAPTASTAEIVARINALAAILRTHRFLDE